MNRSTPPSRRPSTCSRKAARIVRSSSIRSGRGSAPPSGPIEPATSASRAGHVARLAGHLGGPPVEAVGLVGQAEGRQAEPVGPERGGLDEVRAGLEVLAVDRADEVRPGRRELVEAGPLGDAAAVQQRAHRPVGEERPRGEPRAEPGAGRRRLRRGHARGSVSARAPPGPGRVRRARRGAEAAQPSSAEAAERAPPPDEAQPPSARGGPAAGAAGRCTWSRARRRRRPASRIATRSPRRERRQRGGRRARRSTRRSGRRPGPARTRRVRGLGRPSLDRPSERGQGDDRVDGRRTGRAG